MRLVYGFGINDADYVVYPKVDGKRIWCPFYKAWRNMLMRTYSPHEHARYPTYIGTTVCEEWKSFMAFRKWMETQPWQGNQLDKDFLGHKHYSPETCVFIPGWLNSLFLDSGAARGDLPLGVCKHGNGFEMKCSVEGKRKRKYFSCHIEAHASYVEFKTNHVRSLYPRIEAIDPRLVTACERKVAELCTA
jgi:hypothetical protein